jgi:hypothetical protein
MLFEDWGKLLSRNLWLFGKYYRAEFQNPILSDNSIGLVWDVSMAALFVLGFKMSVVQAGLKYFLYSRKHHAMNVRAGLEV